MKVKKMISLLLVLSILLNCLCPISFAAYLYGPEGSSSYSIARTLFGSIANSGGRGGWVYTAQKEVQVQVTKAGIYEVSNSVNTEYMIMKRGADGLLSPLPVATYVENETSTFNIEKYNNKTNNTTSVYLEPDTTYYIVMLGEDGKTGIQNSNNMPEKNNFSSIDLKLKYIDQKEGSEVVEVEGLDSSDYTNPNRTITGTFSIPSGVTNLNQLAYHSSTTQAPSGDIAGVVDGVNAAEEEANLAENEKTTSSWFESMITQLLVIVADGFRSIISTALGGGVSIDSVLFNDYPNTRLSFFSSSRGNSNNQNAYLEQSGMLDYTDEFGDHHEGIITKYFMYFRNIAIVVYLVMLLYMGVRILLASTGAKKDKYKSMMTDWVKGIIILFFFQYAMKYTIVINDALVSYFKEVRTEIGQIEGGTLTTDMSVAELEAIGLTGKPSRTNVMDTMRYEAKETGRLAYAIIYILLIKEFVGFVFIYFKRLVTVIFLILIFPLVTISYAVDKIADGKSQAFGNWYKEFTLNVFLQAFQALNYVIITAVIFALAGESGSLNVILVMIGLEYVSSGDKIIRGMFSRASGGGAGTVSKGASETAKTLLNTHIFTRVTKSVANVGRRVTHFKNSYNETVDRYYDLQDARRKEAQDKAAQARYERENDPLSTENVAIDDIKGNFDAALNLSGARTPEAVKKALDRLSIAQNDPKRKSNFEVEYSRLSAADKDKIDKLMRANESINASVNNDVGVNGTLTNLEMNLNANINIDVVTSGGRGIYKDLYKYTQRHKIKNADGTIARDRRGNEITLNAYLTEKAEARVLDADESRKMSAAQAFVSNIPGIDTREKGSNRVSAKKNVGPTIKPPDKREEARARSIQRRFGTATTDTQSTERQERASKLVASFQTRKLEMTTTGKNAGYSATEAAQIVKEWKELESYRATDAAVGNILDQIGDAYGLEANVGFDLEQFETMTSLAVIADKNNLQGTEEEINEMVSDAIENIVEIAQDENADKICKVMVERAEVDDIIEEFGEQVQQNTLRRSRSEPTQRIDATNWVRQNAGTQEQRRDRKEYQRRRSAVERMYDQAGRTVTVAQAKGNLIRSAVKTSGAAASMAAGPINLAAGVTGAALYGGVTSSDKPGDYAAAVDVGMSLENFVEKGVPGTQAATKSERALGNKIDTYVGDVIKNKTRISDTKVNEMVQRQANRDSAKRRVNAYRNKLT